MSLDERAGALTLTAIAALALSNRGARFANSSRGPLEPLASLDLLERGQTLPSKVRLTIGPMCLAISCSGIMLLGLACGPRPGEAPPPGLPATPVAPDRDAAEAHADPGRLRYPDTRREEVYDTYHGVEVHDPYRWLEDPTAPETRAWIEAQNRLTFGFLERIPAREPIRRRLGEVWDHERYGVPFVEGGLTFFTRNDGLQAQSVLYVAASPDAEPRVLLDPNALSEDGTVALAGTSVSPDGRYLAYGLQAAGSDWTTWRVREIATGADLSGELRWVKFSRPSWSPDSRGFYYGRYPEPDERDKLVGQNYFQRLFYHRVGTPQAEDELVFERPDEKRWRFGTTVSDDGRYLVVSVWRGTGNKNLVYVTDLRKKWPRGARPADRFQPIVSEWKADFRFVGNRGPVLRFFTDLDAPRGRLVAVDLRRPAPRAFRTVLPEAQATLVGVSEVGGRLFANYLEDARSRIRVFDLEGAHVRDVELPGIGSARGFAGRRDHAETFYSFASFTHPPAIYRHDVESGRSAIWRQPKVDFDGDRYQVRQVFYRSKDGTRVPMFLVHRKDLEIPGEHPTLLYGYGGFNQSLTPGFSASRAVWLELGGVYAVANLRGGGEYGEEWHRQGIKGKRQNVFDDFIAAAEWLVANRITTPARLAITGRSNGGLLVAAVAAQRPELFGAALPAVGVLDMLRFQRFTIGWAWIDDYGSSDDPDEFKALHAYSPYHRLRPGTSYPATLVTTGDHDDRVVPGHSFKYAAALQHAQAGAAPVLIRVETRAGHGAGKPTQMRIDEAADEYAFLVRVLGMEDAARAILSP